MLLEGCPSTLKHKKIKAMSHGSITLLTIFSHCMCLIEMILIVLSEDFSNFNLV